MTSRIRLYDRTGRLIYELGAPSFREWVLNDIGNASFTIKAEGMEPYIEFGNYVTIEHDKLDTWVGIIVTPRTWSSKMVTVNAKSAMVLFNQRRGSYQQQVDGSWGAVLSEVIGFANAPETTLLQIGTFDTGISYSSIVDMSNLYTYLQRALAQSQSRMDFRPVVSNGVLKIYIDTQPALYTESDLSLVEGLNIKNVNSILVEQGDIYNDVTILGIGLDQTKFTANAIDAASVALYGLKQVMFAEGTSQSDVDRLAITRLAQYSSPRKVLALTAINKGNTFSNIRVGYSGNVELNSVGFLDGGLGFRGTAYLTTVQFDDRSREANLVCKEIL